MDYEIVLGTHRTSAELSAALKTMGCKVYLSAEEALDSNIVPVEPQERKVRLTSVDVGELFSAPASLEEICEEAWRLGLALCPAEVGPQLRLQYPDQPLGEDLMIAMLAIKNGNGRNGIVAYTSDGVTIRESNPFYFSVQMDRYDSRPTLTATLRPVGGKYSLETRFVFLLTYQL